MAQNIMGLVHRAVDDGGAIEPNATLEVYLAGTSTPVTLYSDRGLTSSEGVSITADAQGVFPERWIASGSLIKLVYKDADGATKYTRDYANDRDELDSSDLDDLGIARIVETYAEMTGLTADQLTDGCTIHVTGDGIAGYFTYNASATTTTNLGTVFAHDTLAGRFIRVIEDDETWFDWFEPDDSGATSCTTEFNSMIAAAKAGNTPARCKCGPGIFELSAEPSDIEDVIGFDFEGAGRNLTTIVHGWDAADRSEGVFKLYGASGGGGVRRCTITKKDGTEGGSAIYGLAKSSTAPDEITFEELYITTSTVKSAQTITAISNASEGVFTAAGHGLSNGDRVVLMGLSGGSMGQLNYSQYTVTDATTDTFKLYIVGTSTYIDTSALGSYSASSGTVRAGECFDAPIALDGTPRSSSPVGIRAVTVSDCQIFGGREASIHSLGVVGLSYDEHAISGAGFNARPHLSGTASVPTSNVILDATTVHGLYMDRAEYVLVRGNIAGDVTDTANTLEFHAQGDISGTYTGLGSYCSTPDFFRLPNGMARQYLDTTGLTGTPATKSWSVAFSAAPENYGAYPTTTVLSSPTTSGIDVADSSSSTSRVWAEGYV